MGKQWSWKGGAAERRDARATKGPEPTRTGPGKKDTRRWCKGKEGREHKPKCMPHATAFESGTWRDGLYKGWFDLVCSVCGKVLARYWPFRKPGAPEPDPDRPEWVK